MRKAKLRSRVAAGALDIWPIADIGYVFAGKDVRRPENFGGACVLRFSTGHFLAGSAMKVSVHSHCAGAERVPGPILEDVVAAAAAVDVRIERGVARRIRDQFVAELRTRGWSSEVTVARGSDMSITSMREGIGLCLQTGNMARMYADLIKLQTLYLDNAIAAGVLVLPSQPVAAAIGDNIAQAARLERELEIFRKAFYVPTLVVSLE